MTLNVAALREITINGDARIENKTLAIPLILGVLYLRQVIQYTALEVVDLVKTQF